MAAKPNEHKEAPPAPADKEPAAPVSAGGGSRGLGAWIPAAAAIVLAPAVSFAVAQFVLLPRLQKQLLGAPLGAPAADAAGADSAGAPGGGAKGAQAGGTYDFSNVVVNLAGTMGTRYLKTSFTVTGASPNFKSVFEANKARMTDITLNVLSSLTLSDLEEPGSKNVLRDKLVAAYNQTLGGRVVDQVYFSDFLIQ